MQAVQPDFWTTSAQTMPVLALAIVVEARAISAKWLPGEGRFSRGVMGAIWATPLVIYAFALPPCFYALSGNTVWSGWVTLIPLGVQVGVSSLILNPTIEILMRANARNVAHLITVQQASAFRKQQRRALRMRRQVCEALLELEKQEIEVRSGRYELERGKRQDHPYKQEFFPLLADALLRIKRSRNELTDLLKEIDTSITDAATKSADFRTAYLDAIEARILGAVANSDKAATDSPTSP